jgi:hypothetical protein
MLLTKEELSAISSYINDNIQIEYIYDSSEYSYTNPILIILDVLLSKNRNYDVIKKNNLDYFEKNYGKIINSLQQVVDLVDENGLKALGTLINSTYESRIEEIYNTCKAFLEFKYEKGVMDDLEAMKIWANNAKKGDFIWNIKGIGPAVFQYLQMLLGIDTVKPDVHIMNFLYKVTERKFKEFESIKGFKEIAEYMGIRVADLDYSVWNYQRSLNSHAISFPEIRKAIETMSYEQLIKVQSLIDNRIFSLRTV